MPASQETWFLATRCPVLPLTQVGLHPNLGPHNNLYLAAALVLFFMSKNRVLFGNLDLDIWNTYISDVDGRLEVAWAGLQGGLCVTGVQRDGN